jgi:hypothetical protein
MRFRWIWIAPVALVGMVAFIALGGWIVQALWNWLLPPLFGWPTITFWQSLALLALCRILFGRLGHFGNGGERMRRRWRERWRERWIGRWERMTPEERERFRRGMHGMWGFGTAGREGEPKAE